MRLSSRLSDNNESHGIVEAIIDVETHTPIREEANDDVIFISAGDFIEIQVGKINLPFYSLICQDSIIFSSPQKLHCLLISSKMISIDCELKCTDCNAENDKCKKCVPNVQAWFLIEADDVFSHTPNINIIKRNYKLPDHIKHPIEMEDKFSEWLGKAEIAHKERLGAGAVIYLRAVFEKITHEVGLSAGVEIYKSNGKVKPFDQVLRAVDAQCSIIPSIYAENGYDLFGKLSEIAHGNSEESTALKEYEALRRLVIGIIENVRRKDEEIKNNNEIRKALNDIGLMEGEKEYE